MSRVSAYQRLISSVPTLILTPEISELSTPEEREGAARRTLCATTGKCPCGATFTIPDHLEPGTVTTITIEHEDGCPAVMADV